MVENNQFNLRISKERRKEWEEQIGPSSEFDSIANLIRTSVQRQIAESEDDNGPLSPGFESDLEEIKNELSEIKADVTELHSYHQSEVGISDLAQDVFEELQGLPQPTSPVHVPENVDMDATEYRRYLGAIQIIEPEDADGSREPQTARAIADRLDEKTSRVRAALDHLQEQFLPVVEVEIEGRTHYFKEA